ncbi:MAG: glycosyltransferase [Lachnospiraceae bacterium]|nr:glycosyltransferase [Lachnospiraceae bacterium]
MKALVSIIVPIFNVEQYLEKCIKSILNQTMKDLEIILVDDGSTDGSPQMCDFFDRQDDRIRVIHKRNGGLVSARKAGLQAAVGEYVGYVDGDDWIESDLYERMLDYAVRYQVDVVETEHFIDAGAVFKRVKSKLAYGRCDARELIPIMLCDNDFNECRLQPFLWSKLFKRQLLQKHQMQVDEAILCGEDIAVVYPCILDTKSIYVADYAGYHYVQRCDSMTGMQNYGREVQDRALISYLRTVFDKNEQYSSLMLRQLNQYTKSMLLLRQISFFDRDSGSTNIKLLPFGGVNIKDRIALYCAGRMGKQIYGYLKELNGEGAVMWADKEYALYQQLGLPVISPKEVVARQEEYDVLLIAVNSKKVSQAIRQSLIKIGLKENRAVWLTEKFICDDNYVLEDFLC